MDNTSLGLNQFLNLSGLNMKGKQSKANLLALMAATMHYFIDLIMDEVDRAGFVGVEFLEKTIFFLRTVTPKYPSEKYDLILQTLKDVDNQFPQTEFYYGLESLRKITTGINQDHLSIIQGNFKADINIHADQHTELGFFTTYLIENTISYITRLRMSKNVTNFDNSSLKQTIDDKFDNCVIQTVINLEEVSKMQ